MRNLRQKFISVCGTVLCGYLLVFVVYQICRPLADDSKDVPVNPSAILNHLMPSPEDYDWLVSTYQQNGEFDRRRLQVFIDYYSEVARYLPERFEAHGLLGFCYYQSKEYEQALQSYDKAAAIHPSFFWFHYNTGVILNEMGQTQSVVPRFKAAQTAAPQATLQGILNSGRLYGPIVARRFTGDNTRLLRELQEGYRQTAAILQIKDRAPEEAWRQAVDSLRIKLF